MKLQGFSHIYLCPNTGEQVSLQEFSRSLGTCPRCGNTQRGSFTHAVKEVGRWEMPSFFERLRGHKAVWHPMEKETS